MSQITRGKYSGLLVPDSRLVYSNIDTTLSDYTQGDRIPGVPAPQNTTKIKCYAAGEQADKTYEIYVSQPGLPDASGFLWREQSEATYGYLGQERPTMANQLMVLDDVGPQNLHACTMKNGRVVVAYGAGSVSEIRTAYYDGGAAFSSPTTIISDSDILKLEVDDTDSGVTYAGCAMIYDEVLDKIYLFVRVFYEIDIDAGGDTRLMQIYTYETSDGESWSLKSKNAIVTVESTSYSSGIKAGGFQFKNMAAIFVGRAIMLFSEYRSGGSAPYTYRLGVFVSYDYGATLQSIEIVSNSDVVEIKSAGNAVMYRSDTTGSAPRFKRFDAIKPWTAVDEDAPLGDVSFTYSSEYAFLKLRTGKYVAYLGQGGGSGSWYDLLDQWGASISFSSDIFGDGATELGNCIDLSVADGSLKDYAAAEYGGGILLFARSSYTDYMSSKTLCFVMGGFSNCCVSDYVTAGGTALNGVINMASLCDGIADGGSTYPFYQPDDTGYWTKSGAGSPTIAQDGDDRPYFSFSSSGTDPFAFYTHAITSSDYAPGEVIVELEARTATTTTTSSIGCGVRILYDDGSLGTNAFLGFYSSGGTKYYRLYDYHASTVLYSASFGSNESLKFRIVFKQGRIALFVSDNVGSNYNGIINWTLVYQGDLTTSATVSTLLWVSFGVNTNDPGDTWGLYYINFVSNIGDFWDLSAATSIAGNQVDYRYPVLCSTKQTYLEDGLYLSWAAGPSVLADTFLLAPGYKYPIQNMLPLSASSPDMEWRSADDDSEQIIVFQPQSGQLADFETSAVSITLIKPNFKQAFLEISNDGGSTWTEIAEINTAYNFEGLSYGITSLTDRSGVCMVPATGTDAAPRPLFMDELKDGYAILTYDDGATPNELTVKITGNTEGVWDDVSSLKTRVFLESFDDSGAPDFTYTAVDIILPKITYIIPDISSVFDTDPLTNSFSHLRLRIPVQTTADGYFRLSKALIGSVYVFPQDYSWGQTLATEQNYKITQPQNGRRFATNLGKKRQKKAFGWTEYAGDDTHLYNAVSSTPNYLALSASGEPIAFTESTHYLVEGLLNKINGAVTPVVMCGSIVSGTDPIVITDPKNIFYGRVVSSFSRNETLGDDFDTQVWTVANIEIEEEV